MTKTNLTWGLGRRKTSTARVRIQPGAGAFFINGRALDNFFPVLEHRNRATSPLKLLEGVQYDVFATVDGGGLIGQADAVRLGLARALKTVNPSLDSGLRGGGHLTRDSRMKERKKYGRRGARRGFQFSKR
ncbi:MAG: 30S ribosomal protein S9 [Planctomycetes bacterium]|nr:30S ribosomal protein S9 [Planctomycetota bacterium]